MWKKVIQKLIFLYVFNCFNTLILKIILKKYIILIYFNIKNILKNNHNNFLTFHEAILGRFYKMD